MDVDLIQTARLLDQRQALALVKGGMHRHQRMARTVNLSTTASQAMGDVDRTRTVLTQVLEQARVHANKDTRRRAAMESTVPQLTTA